MRETRLLPLLIILSIGIIPAHAQLTFGIRGGLNVSHQLERDEDEVYSNDDHYTPRIGFHLGGVVLIPVSKVLFVETGGMLTTKGYRFEDDENSLIYSEEMNLAYLEIPLHLKYQHSINENLSLFGNAGLNAGIGLHGSITESYESNVPGIDDENEERSIKWGKDSDDDDLKRLELGMTLGAGVVIKQFQVGLFYDWGLNNISPYIRNEYSIKNRVFRLSIAYMFN